MFLRLIVSLLAPFNNGSCRLHFIVALYYNDLVVSNVMSFIDAFVVLWTLSFIFFLWSVGGSVVFPLLSFLLCCRLYGFFFIFIFCLKLCGCCCFPTSYRFMYLSSIIRYLVVYWLLSLIKDADIFREIVVHSFSCRFIKNWCWFIVVFLLCRFRIVSEWGILVLRIISNFCLMSQFSRMWFTWMVNKW